MLGQLDSGHLRCYVRERMLVLKHPLKGILFLFCYILHEYALS
jgi:hypothetical protein